MAHLLRMPTRRSDSIRLIATAVCMVLALCVGMSCDRRLSADDQTQVAPPTPSTAATQSSERPWLVDITDQVGLDFTHESGATGHLYMPEIAGSGGALFDFDN